MSWIEPFGFNKVSADFTAFGNSLTRHLESAMQQWFITRVIPSARQKAPSLTGKLKGAIGIVQILRGSDKISFIVGWGTRAQYGKFVERGTKFMEARQFMRRAIIEQTPGIGDTWVRQISISEVSNYKTAGVSIFTFKP